MGQIVIVVFFILSQLVFWAWLYKKVYPRGMFADVVDDIEFLKSVRRGEVDFTSPIKVEIENNKEAKRKYNPDDYWEEEVDYGTGEIITNTGPTIRHPKNRDRAYSGSVERFHDGSR